MSKGSKQRPIDDEWDESVVPPKRPKFIQEMLNEGARSYDEAEKRIADFMLEGKK